MTDFNNIKQWLDQHLEKRNWSVERFSRLCGLSRAIIYFYRNDTYRPDVENMARMCRALDVPLAEGLAQYSPRPDGRPPLRDDSGKRGKKGRMYRSHA